MPAEPGHRFCHLRRYLLQADGWDRGWRENYEKNYWKKRQKSKPPPGSCGGNVRHTAGKRKPPPITRVNIAMIRACIPARAAPRSLQWPR